MRKLSTLLLPLLLTGCVQAGSSPSPTATPAPYYQVSADPNDLILRIDSGGGLVPMSYLLTHMPQWSLYADGRIVVQGPMIEIYPQPLLPNLRLMRVTPSEIQTILAEADKAGLLGPDASYSAGGIADASTTIFTLTVDGQTHHISAYALMEGATADNKADEDARAKLMDFDRKIGDLTALLGREVTDKEAFEPGGMQIFVRPASGDDTVQGVEPNRIAWPLAVDPATAGTPTTVPQTRCVLATGQDLSTFLVAAKQATTVTIWTHGSQEYSVMVRPLLPDETSCVGEKPE
jgi:hypothetical protein